MLNKKVVVIWSILLVILLVTGVFAYLWQHGSFAHTSRAILTIQHGSASVFLADGTREGLVAQQDFAVGETVQTFDGEVLLTIDQNYYLWLRPQSKLSLQEHADGKSTVMLLYGSVWYMHVNSSDVEQFVVDTPMTSVIPAGTRLLVTFDAIESVAATTVMEGSAIVKDEFDELSLGEFEKARKTDIKPLEKVPMDGSDISVASEQVNRDYAIVRAARSAEIKRFSVPLSIIKSKYDISDEQIEQTLQRIDRGEISEESLLAQSPVPLPDLTRLRTLTEEARSTLAVQKKLAQLNLTH